MYCAVRGSYSVTPLPPSPSPPSRAPARAWLRPLLDIFLRLLAVFFAASLCSALTVNQPVLRLLYDAAVGYVAFWGSLGGAWWVVGGRVILALGYSVLALTTALVVALALGTLAGFLAGARPTSLLSGTVRALSYLGTMTPSFLLALFIMVFFVLWVLPLTGIRFILISGTASEFDPRRLLPIALTLTARPLALFTSVVAAATQDALGSDFARTAYSKGLTRGQVLFRHIWPNVLPALMPSVPIALLFSLSSLPIVEFVFNWPGAGRELLFQVVTSVRSNPYNAAQVAFLLTSLGLTYVLLLMVTEALRRRVDPLAREDAG